MGTIGLSIFRNYTLTKINFASKNKADLVLYFTSGKKSSRPKKIQEASRNTITLLTQHYPLISITWLNTERTAWKLSLLEEFLERKNFPEKYLKKEELSQKIEAAKEAPPPIPAQKRTGTLIPASLFFRVSQ
jgi:hypothetical protein